MKRAASVLLVFLYSLGYAVPVSFGAVCFLNVAVIVLSPFGSTGQYPRFLPFCVLGGLAAFLLCVLLLVCNARWLLNHSTHLRRKIAGEILFTLALTPPGMWLWEMLLAWLQKVL